MKIKHFTYTFNNSKFWFKIGNSLTCNYQKANQYDIGWRYIISYKKSNFED